MNENPILPKEFWKHVQKGPNCWEWVGGRTATHGYFYYEGLAYVAHRVVCEGVTKSVKVMHTCGNKYCVNPAHIEVKKKKEKVINKNPFRSGINWAVVLKIRSSHHNPEDIRRLAKQYGVAVSTIYNIIARKTWK